MSKRSYGDGGISQRGENSFRLRYRVKGKRYEITFKGTLAEAKTELRRLLRSGDDGSHVAPDTSTLAAFAQAWLDAGAPGRRQKRVGPRSQEHYSAILHRHVLPELGSKKLQDIDATDIDRLYIGLESKIHARTAKQVHSVLNACLAHAVRTRKLALNPMAAITAVPSPGEPNHGVALDDEQLRKLLTGFKAHPLHAIVATAAFTGARRNEVLALRWSDLDVQKKTLRIERALEETNAHGIRFKGPKSEKHKRTITIDDDLLTLLIAEREKHLRLVAGVPDGAAVDLGLIKLPADALMFPTPGDFVSPRHPRATTMQFRHKATRLGFKGLRFHDLRGTHETLLLDRGVPVHVVAARCGHDPAVLLRSYAKRTHKADTSAASVIGTISKGILG
jgi:integrase